MLSQLPFTVCPSGKDDVLDIEIDSYIHCISAFVKLAQSEYVLLAEIIPEHHQKKTFDSLIQVRVQRSQRSADVRHLCCAPVCG